MKRSLNGPGQSLGHRSRGSVLIVVLWASLGLVSVALLFGHAMLLNYRGADNDLSGRQAEQAIDGASRYLLSLLAKPETPGRLPEISAYERDAVPVGEATFWLLGRPAESGDGLTREYGLIDETAKLNLNTATVAMLGALPGMTEELAAAIVDWRDSDDELTTNGAESETYQRLQPPYDCKNGPFESIEELALVSGADRTLLEGEDANHNGVLDPNEDDGDKSLPPDNSDGKLDSGLLEYVTVYSREPNKRSDGTARINISQPSAEFTALLSETFGASRLQEIQGQIGQNARFRSALEFYARSGLSSEEFEKIADAITVGTGDYLPGLINVNTASEVVLACVPGIGAEKAASIVTTRASAARTDASMTWVVEILGPAGTVQAGPYLTGKSYQMSADVAAVGRHARGYRRTRLVFDLSTGTPRVIYRRNLAPLGWALGNELRQSLAQQKNIR